MTMWCNLVRTQFFILLILLPSLLSGQDTANYKSEFGFRTENDAYLAVGQDRYYTNGLFITYRHALPAHNPSAKTIKRTWELEAGHFMYNAVSGQIRRIEDVDRPFAAYLYGGARFNWFKENEQIFQASLQFGTIGPKALGKEVQETLHDIVGFYEIRGWEYQLFNESGINSSFSYSRLLARPNKNNDFSINTYANLGTTLSGAGVGILYRTGAINKLFNSVSTNSRISNSVNDSLPPKEVFFFARPNLQLNIYNATIQGGLFRENKGPVSYTPNRLLFSQELGVMYAQKRWTLNFSLIFQSKEIKTQRKAQQYGSASIFYRFGT